MRYYWKKAAATGFLVFLGLWVVGVLRSAAQPYPEPTSWQFSGFEELSVQNVSANNLKLIGLALKPLPFVLDQADVDRIQVYEKTAQLATESAQFTDDVAKVREALAAHRATVLNEKDSGIAPARRLTLEIGINPDRFDALVTELRQVGRLESVYVQQRDRTGEFRKLHAQRASLKKHLEAVQKLRGGPNPKIDDQLKLEQKIQDIEKELQTLSVEFGDLLGKESFYQVHLTLYEFQPGSRLDHSFTLPKRIANGYLWAAAWWCALAAAVGMLAATYISVRTLCMKPAAATLAREAPTS